VGGEHGQGGAGRGMGSGCVCSPTAQPHGGSGSGFDSKHRHKLSPRCGCRLPSALTSCPLLHDTHACMRAVSMLPTKQVSLCRLAVQVGCAGWLCRWSVRLPPTHKECVPQVGAKEHREGQHVHKGHSLGGQHSGACGCCGHCGQHSASAHLWDVAEHTSVRW
jgi:hypothetical protein